MQLVDENVRWQTLCNEKDTEMLELRQRLTEAENLVSQHRADICQCQCTSSGDVAEVRIVYIYSSICLCTWRNLTTDNRGAEEMFDRFTTCKSLSITL